MVLMLSTMVAINMIFFFTKHPMSMGFTLIIQTINISLLTGMMTKTFWVSYIMIITILSGMLVLFIYMASIASNEKFKNNKKIWLTALSTLAVIMIPQYINKTYILQIYKSNFNLVEMNKSKSIIFLNKLFSLENMYLTTMLIMYLFFTMIVASFIINIHEGPLRQKF